MKSYTIYLLLCTSLILQGCVSAIIVGTTVVATKTAHDPRSVGTQIDDSVLAVRITNALSRDKQLKKYTRIVNNVYQGKVLLTGQATSMKLAERAQMITLSFNKTLEVYNEIRQAQPISLTRILLDTLISIKICAVILFNNTVNLSHIKIITENSEVFLLGLVTHDEGNNIVKNVSKVRGVKNIIIAFTYLT